MTIMESRIPAGRVKAGSCVVLIGLLAFGIGCFIPAVQFVGLDGAHKLSFYRLLFSSTGGTVSNVATFLIAFSGALVVAMASVIGTLRRCRPWVPPVLAATVTIWSLTWIGLLLIDQYKHLAGYWLIVGSLAVGVAGAVMAVGSRRGRSTDAADIPRR